MLLVAALLGRICQRLWCFMSHHGRARPFLTPAARQADYLRVRIMMRFFRRVMAPEALTAEGGPDGLPALQER